jgi:Xaa-Pro aminopeptidase
MTDRHRYHIQRYPDFPQAEYESRWRRLRSRMAAGGIDAAIFTTEQNIRYVTGFKTVMFQVKMRPMIAVLPTRADQPPALVIPEFLEATALATTWLEDIHLGTECYGQRVVGVEEVLLRVLHKLNLDAAAPGFELNGHQLALSQQQFVALTEALPAARIVDVGDLIWQVRRVKSAPEVEAFKTACDITCAGIQAGFEVLRPGMREDEFWGHVLAAYYRAGAESHMLTLHATPKGNQVRDALPSPYPFQPGHFMKMDGAAGYKGYRPDFCRMMSVGRLAEDQRRCIALSAQANAAAAASARAGVRVAQLHAPVRSVLEPAGFGFFWNAIGHGVGMDVHEPPYLYTDCQEELAAGNIISIEVGIVNPERFDDASYTIEDNWLITEMGAVKLSDGLPTDLLEKV